MLLLDYMNRSRASWKKIVLGIVIGVLAIAAFGFGIHWIEERGLEDVQFGDTGGWGKEEIDPVELDLDNELYVSDDDIDTYLLMGLDPGRVQQGEMYSGELADFLTLMVVDNTTKKFGFIQLDRNSMVPMEIPDEDGNIVMLATQQLCLAHWYGRTPEERNEFTINAVSSLLGGLDINSCYTIKMEDIGAVNKAIGGIEVDIDTDMTDIDPAFKKGATVRLTDKQAEKFLQARMGVGDETNAARMKRQSQYMQKAYNLIMNQLRENPEYINDLYQELDGKIYTDSQNRDFSQIANKMVKYDSQGILQLTGTTKLADTQGDGEEHEEFYVNEDSIVKCLSKIMNISKAPEDYYDQQDVEDDDGADAAADDAADADSDDEDTDTDAAPGMGDPDKIQVVETGSAGSSEPGE